MSDSNERVDFVMVVCSRFDSTMDQLTEGLCCGSRTTTTDPSISLIRAGVGQTGLVPRSLKVRPLSR